MRYWVAIPLLMLAAPAAAQSTNTDCNTMGTYTACRSTTTQPWTMPPITQVDVAGALRMAAERRRTREREPEYAPHPPQPIDPPALTSAEIDAMRPTARDFYIGCSLLIENDELQNPIRHGLPLPKSAIGCALASDAIRDATGLSLKPCMPVSVTDTRKALATAFVETYDRLHDKIVGKRDGFSTFSAIAAVRWPCPAN